MEEQIDIEAASAEAQLRLLDIQRRGAMFGQAAPSMPTDGPQEDAWKMAAVANRLPRERDELARQQEEFDRLRQQQQQHREQMPQQRPPADAAAAPG